MNVLQRSRKGRGSGLKIERKTWNVDEAEAEQVLFLRQLLFLKREKVNEQK